MAQSALTQRIDRRPAYWDNLFTFLQRLPHPEPMRCGKAATLGFGSLVLVWAVLFHLTWAHWGAISVDNGREMYVPWELMQGKTLYRDIWYLYTPGGPYLNSLLFRVFGAQLSVLYWAGSLSALGCALLLYQTGVRLSSWLAGWTAGALVLAQAFVPDLFSFPLPYSYGAVYGALATCLFLWMAVRASSCWGWMFGAGLAAAAALAFKPEFGAGCYAALAVLVTLRACQANSLRRMRYDLLSIAPGVCLSLAMIGWMVSLRGVWFITQQNLMSWPTHYFMKTYGARWLQVTGLGTSRRDIVKAVAGLSILLLYLGVRMLFKRYGLGWRTFLVGLVLVSGLAGGMLTAGRTGEITARFLLFPPSMVFLIGVASPVLWIAAWQKKWPPGALEIVVLCIGAFGVAARILVGMKPSGYPAYYNGPVILAFLLLAEVILFPKDTIRARMVRPGRLPFYIGVLVIACIPLVHDFVGSSKTAALMTDRGTIYLSPVKAREYAAAVDFMKRAAKAGKHMMSVPEDTGLYFLSGTHCPTRIFAFTPGAVAPEEMAQEIRDIDRAPVQYLIWSNRTFREYGVTEFGTDFDKSLGDYFRSHFRPLRKVLLSAPEHEWSATIWERLPEISTP